MNFIAYHQKSSEKSIDSLVDLQAKAKTDKNFSSLEGNTLWLLGGVETPIGTDYVLKMCFVVNHTDTHPTDGWLYVKGESGSILQKAVSIGSETWFQVLLKSQFQSHGIQQIDKYPDVVAEFAKIIENQNLQEEGDSRIVEDILSINKDGDLSDTEKKKEIAIRCGQGTFRKNVVKEWGEEICALTLTQLPDLLTASHVKPWRACQTKEERLDGANGILLCAHIDRLFDRYLITFYKERGEYKLKYSKRLNPSVFGSLRQLGVEEGVSLASSNLTPQASRRFDQYIEQHNAGFEQRDLAT